MLKIKDSVNMEVELPKFEFKFNHHRNKYETYHNRALALTVDINTREINGLESFRDSDDNDSAFEILFDLIQAGLVEKVE